MPVAAGWAAISNLRVWAWACALTSKAETPAAAIKDILP
jgi:hypothetical protein